MTETIYRFVSYYSFYKNIIDTFTKNSLPDISHICNKDRNNFKNVKSTCYNVLMFLNHLEANNNLVYIAVGCRFLNYWLYNDDVLNNTNNFNAVTFYETLEKDNKHGYFHRDLCGGNIEHIGKEIFAKIQKLIELHEKFNKIVPTKEPLNYKCEETLECANLYEKYMQEFCVDINNVFCVELENFKPKYDSYMKEAICDDKVPKTLTSIQRLNIAAAIVLPFVIILVIPFITFILYKFTSFGPLIHSIISKKNRISNNLSEENQHLALLVSETHEPYQNKSSYSIAYRSI
ncbi:PIR Superfamily Protein [Plasmodium ovale wallikeri]|uniref:PIR Superfamily Protein n=1 Tax=Plasmodium ovale wallikeri TaxID=864142 RepID=A0A1A9AJW9_PLAOA|nr:PIR Superfamily Protein [Plasmodium ovale wallikeri]SBT56375.1 PIR Superfamily Protein [Plasmodium ovale wallikeri]